jgi:hypothetical protein
MDNELILTLFAGIGFILTIFGTLSSYKNLVLSLKAEQKLIDLLKRDTKVANQIQELTSQTHSTHEELKYALINILNSAIGTLPHKEQQQITGLSQPSMKGRFNYAQKLMRKSGMALPVNQVQKVTTLTQWLKKEFTQATDMGWQMLEEAFGGPVAAFRDSLTIKRAKPIHLGTDDTFILVVEIKPPKNNEEVEIILRLQTKKEGSYLPENLELTLLSDSGEPLQKPLQAGNDKDVLIQPLTASQGERFSVKMALGEVSVTENFVV